MSMLRLERQHLSLCLFALVFASWTETVKTFAVFPSCLHLVDCDDNCMLSVPLKHERPSQQQMAKWQNLPGVVHCELHVVLPRVHGFNEGLLSFFLLSCPRVCLLDVCCLLGLTLRPSAPVCSCHQVSLTRRKLAFEQEAVRVSSSHSPR